MQRGQDNEIWNEDGTGSGRRGMGIQGGPEFNSSDPMSNQPQQGFRGENQARFGNDDNAAFSSGGGPGQFGNNVDPAMQGGDFTEDPMGGGSNQRASAGRDDNALNFGSSAGPAMSDGSGNPGTGDKFMGSMQKAAGRVSGNTNLVERGEMRKTGGPQADDTLL